MLQKNPGYFCNIYHKDRLTYQRLAQSPP